MSTHQAQQRPVRHLVDREPEHPRDTSGVLCIRAGDCKQGREYAPGQRRHGWTQDPAKVTCPRCLEWIHG